MCRNYDAGPCQEPGCDGRITCLDFNDQRCWTHSINGAAGEVFYEEPDDAPPISIGEVEEIHCPGCTGHEASA